MIRLIKRYESRKLYDTEESRYVSLEEIAGWVRQGQEVRVLDNATSGDVTSQTLTQIILDEGRRGTSSLPSELLHELVRLGERAVHSGVEQVQHGVDRLVQASIDRLAPVRRAREEMSGLRTRLEQLEVSLAALDSEVLVGLAEAAGSQESAGSVPAAAGDPGDPGDHSAGNGSATGAGAETAAPAAAERADGANRPDRSERDTRRRSL
jgi:polyhydroxyalkanoate synthesis repressor PhaR